MPISEMYYINQFHNGEIELEQLFALCKARADSLELCIELLKAQASRKCDPKSFHLLAEAYRNVGDNFSADAVTWFALKHDLDMHISHYVNSRIERVLAIVDDRRKLLYIPIPKCGSSTIKNYFTFCTKGKTYGEFVHFNHAELSRHVLKEELSTTYREYFKFSVVRDPLSRVVSYFQKNVVGGALRRDSLGENECFGLATMPGPWYCADRFFEYRQIFIDFRHHTDPIGGYIGHLCEHLDRVYGMSDMSEIRAKLSDCYETEIKDLRAMSGDSSRFDPSVVRKAFEKIRGFYDEDYKMLKRLGMASEKDA